MELGCCSKCRMMKGAPGEVPTRPAIMPKPRDEGAGLYRPPSRPLRRSSSRSTLTKLTDRPRNPTIRSHLMRQAGRESHPVKTSPPPRHGPVSPRNARRDRQASGDQDAQAGHAAFKLLELADVDH